MLQFNPFTGGSSQGGLTITTNSTLDISDDHLFINYGSNPDPVATIRSYLIKGYNGGAWNGTGAAIDTSAPTSISTYGVGYADGADHVVTGLSSGQIEIKYTLVGDANLDGLVTGDDFTLLVANIGKAAAAWDKGDFNYDGLVTGDDFTATRRQPWQSGQRSDGGNTCQRLCGDRCVRGGEWLDGGCSGAGDGGIFDDSRSGVYDTTPSQRTIDLGSNGGRAVAVLFFECFQGLAGHLVGQFLQ